ncbi:MAG: RNase adapter RapZ [Alphaproteobacteria bacterium]
MTDASTRPPASHPGTRLVVVTGMSGAGRTTVLRALEDVGYEAVDNLPLKLLGSIVPPEGLPGRGLAIDVDVRTRDFTERRFTEVVTQLFARAGIDGRLVFVDCDDEALRRRFTETRRRHPLAKDRAVLDGIQHERRLIAGLRLRADLVIDTTALSVADLRRLIAGHYALEPAGLAVAVVSFAFPEGLPRESDLMFDVRFLANPHYAADLGPLTGRDEAVGAYIAADPAFAPFIQGLAHWLMPLLARYEREGKSYLTLAVGCTGGRHRSVFVAERLAAMFAAQGRQVHLIHRDLRPSSAETVQNVRPIAPVEPSGDDPRQPGTRQPSTRQPITRQPSTRGTP